MSGLTAVERFWRGIDKTESCWLWTRSRVPKGYGTFGVNGRTTYVHRFAYELFVGPIPEGLVIDHLCRNTSCANPEHLEAVTQSENLRRGMTGKVNNPQTTKTACPAGHQYDSCNTYGARRCSVCIREVQRRWWQQHREMANARRRERRRLARSA